MPTAAAARHRGPWHPSDDADCYDVQVELKRRGWSLVRLGRVAAHRAGRTRPYSHSHVRVALGTSTVARLRDDHVIRRLAAEILGVSLSRLPRPKARAHGCAYCGAHRASRQASLFG